MGALMYGKMFRDPEAGLPPPGIPASEPALRLLPALPPLCMLSPSSGSAANLHRECGTTTVVSFEAIRFLLHKLLRNLCYRHLPLGPHVSLTGRLDNC